MTDFYKKVCDITHHFVNFCENAYIFYVRVSSFGFYLNLLYTSMHLSECFRAETILGSVEPVGLIPA